MDIETIEDELINTIKQNMSYLKTVDLYQGELDEDDIKKVARRFPAVLIYMEAADYVNRGYPLKWQKVSLTFLVCDKNLRTRKQVRRGSSTNPGTYKILKDLFDHIYNSDLGLTDQVHPLDIEREEAIVNRAGVSIYAATYKTQFAKN